MYLSFSQFQFLALSLFLSLPVLALPAPCLVLSPALTHCYWIDLPAGAVWDSAGCSVQPAIFPWPHWAAGALNGLGLHRGWEYSWGPLQGRLWGRANTSVSNNNISRATVQILSALRWPALRWACVDRNDFHTLLRRSHPTWTWTWIWKYTIL